MVYGFFQKITDYREIDEVIYKPKLCYINACNFTARGFSYKENFPFFHSSSSARWNFIDSLLENNESVTISHKINPCNDDNAHIYMLVWNGDLDMEYTLHSQEESSPTSTSKEEKKIIDVTHIIFILYLFHFITYITSTFMI